MRSWLLNLILTFFIALFSGLFIPRLNDNLVIQSQVIELNTLIDSVRVSRDTLLNDIKIDSDEFKAFGKDIEKILNMYDYELKEISKHD